MKIVKPKTEVIFFNADNGMSIEQIMEYVGRTCYKSEDKITDDSANKFVKMIRDSHHDPMLEFGYFIVKITADRGFTHEIVRHRVASFAQESTRYCNYSKGKFDGEISVIEPEGLDERERGIWLTAMLKAEFAYMDLINEGVVVGLTH